MKKPTPQKQIDKLEKTIKNIRDFCNDLKKELQEIKEKTVEIYDSEFRIKEKKKWPQCLEEGDDYWTFDGAGLACLVFYKNDAYDQWQIKNNSCFRTKEEAQNRIDLIDHIAEFKEPEEGYWVVVGGMWYRHGYGQLEDRPMSQAGLIMSEETTEEQRAERLILLKKCYE